MLHLATGIAVGILVALALTNASAPTIAAAPSIAAGVAKGPAAPSSGSGSSALGARMAGTWWICSTGENLEVDGPRVRCRMPSQTIDVVPSCGVGHALVLNLAGNRDRCRNMMGGLLDYTCPVPHFSPVITSGQDICRRTTNGSVSPPAIKISY